jgi:AAA domain
MSVQSPATPAKPRLQLLSQWLKEPDKPMRWIIDQWMNDGSRILTYAQWKAGKTTLISNLVRSVADGDPFLGEAATTPLNDGETIVLLDFEMSDKQLKEWTRRRSAFQRSSNRHWSVADAARNFARPAAYGLGAALSASGP